MIRTTAAALLAGLIAGAAPAMAQEPDRPDYGQGYTIAELLEPCVTADNDARGGARRRSSASST